MDLGKVKTTVQMIAGVVAGFWQGLPALTQLLLAFMALDILFGVAVAIRYKQFSPGTAWLGATKKIATLGIVAAAALLQYYLPMDFGVSVTQTASAWYLVSEIGSVIRNAATLDVLVPPQFTQVLDYFDGMSGNKTKREV